MPPDFGEGGGEYRAAADCETTLRELRDICKDPVGESAVKRQITSVSCGLAIDPSFVLKDGVLKTRRGYRESIDKVSQCFPSARLCYLRDTLRVDGANGDSLKVSAMKLDQEKALAADIRRFNKFCESNIDVKFDWTDVPAEWSAKRSEFEFKPLTHCSSALRVIEEVCRRDADRTAVQEQIKNVTCGFGPERSISLKDGALNFKMNFDEESDINFISTYLHEHL